ncbi:restriction endonuclease subunit S [Nostoc sp.]|uniref:restriction endonuclease subunit S n=1 Tax=Nostoc sp. TaxID=1180 RepID=UPI002FF968F8
MKKPVTQTNFGLFIQDWKLAYFPDYVYFQEGPGLRTSQFTDSGIKVINVKNILLDGTIDISNSERYISLEEFDKKYKHFAIEVGDIVVSSSGWSYGKVGRIQQNHLPLVMNTSVIRFRPLWEELLDANFLYYFLCSSFFRNQIESFIIGCQQPNFGPAHIKRMQIPIISINTQKKIAAILSGYDDLIENNTRRIKILEEMAQTLYHEWFVKFRFPGHEHTKMVDSELGLIPEGWIGKLEDALILQRGFDLPTKTRQQGNVPVYAATGITGWHNDAKIKTPCVITGRSGSLGTVMYVDEDFWALNTTLWVKEFRKVTPIYAFYLLSSLGLEQYNSGAAVPTLNRNDIHGLSVVIPPSPILEQFNSHVDPLFKLKKNLIKRNENLCQTRDLLLPKLISGEIDVEHLDITTEDIAA